MLGEDKPRVARVGSHQELALKGVAEPQLRLCGSWFWTTAAKFAPKRDGMPVDGESTAVARPKAAYDFADPGEVQAVGRVGAAHEASDFGMLKAVVGNRVFADDFARLDVRQDAIDGEGLGCVCVWRALALAYSEVVVDAHSELHELVVVFCTEVCYA